MVISGSHIDHTSKFGSRNFSLSLLPAGEGIDAEF
jgi:hypothetical protein